MSVIHIPTMGSKSDAFSANCARPPLRTYEHFKGIFDGHGQGPTKGRINAARFTLGAVFVYQLGLLYRFEAGLDLGVGLKACLKAA